MSFAHAGEHTQTNEPVCIADVAREAVSLLALNREHAVYYLNDCKPEHWVEGDNQRLVQVLVNLLSNARDASPTNGNIRVYSLANEQQVELIVEDEGSGIPRSIIDRLFEPFFTTKDPGKGTGLGLALVYSIIEEHYGHISIDSPCDVQRQRGTRICITLPRLSLANSTH